MKELQNLNQQKEKEASIPTISMPSKNDTISEEQKHSETVPLMASDEEDEDYQSSDASLAKYINSNQNENSKDADDESYDFFFKYDEAKNSKQRELEQAYKMEIESETKLRKVSAIKRPSNKQKQYVRSPSYQKIGSYKKKKTNRRKRTNYRNGGFTSSDPVSLFNRFNQSWKSDKFLNKRTTKQSNCMYVLSKTQIND